MINPYKTRVFRTTSGSWRVFYYIAYSGMLMVDCSTWDEAMQEAWAVERQRGWE